jgi:DNA polymerase-3 subunit delta'
LGKEDLEQAVRGALERDGHEIDSGTLAMALDLSEGSVRRALELVSSGGIELYREILAALGDLPEIESPRLHRLVDRLAGNAESQRFDLYLALLLGLIERLIRLSATEAGGIPEEQRLARRLLSAANLAHWAKAWESISEAKGEAQALNLDRGLLLLESWFRLQQVARDHPA